MRRLLLAIAALGIAACSPSGSTASATASTSGLDLAPRVVDRASGGDQRLLVRQPVTMAAARMDLPAHATPGGADTTAEGAKAIAAGAQLVVLGDTVAVDGVEWRHVYVLDTLMGGGTPGFFSWIPGTIGGQPTIGPASTPACPPTRDNLSTLSALDPFTRARCVGATAFTIEGTVRRKDTSFYDVTPTWFGPRGSDAPSFSVYPSTSGSLPIRVPTDIELPPPDITIRATVHVADTAATSCRRTDSSGFVPAETSSDSVLWCSVQAVLEQWVPVLGLAGRPFDAASPQLRQGDLGSVCAGVGMSPAAFRVDPARLDPVWVERDGSPIPIGVWFGPEFRFALQPAPVIVDDTGATVVRDGLPFDPDKGLPGHAICPTGVALLIY